MRYLLLWFVVFVLLLVPISVQSKEIEWGVEVGDSYTWSVTSVESNDASKSKDDVFIIIWWEWESDNENGTNYDYFVPHGIYPNESVEIIIDFLPNSTMFDDEPTVNGDYAKGKILTPRFNTTTWLSPALTETQFVIPTNFDIESNFDGHEFNENGVLSSATLEIQQNETTYTVILSNNNTEDGFLPYQIETILTVLVLGYSIRRRTTPK